MTPLEHLEKAEQLQKEADRLIQNQQYPRADVTIRLANSHIKAATVANKYPSQFDSDNETGFGAPIDDDRP